MLNSLLGVETTRVKERPFGTIYEREGKIRKITSARRVNPDDWFADEEWELTLTKPWVERKPSIKIEWLEDALMPRFQTVSASAAYLQ